LTPSEAAEKRRQLTDDGFCVVERVLPDPMMERLREVSDAMLARQDAAHFKAQRSTGSMSASQRGSGGAGRTDTAPF